jgi:hypothetical protein
VLAHRVILMREPISEAEVLAIVDDVLVPLIAVR